MKKTKRRALRSKETSYLLSHISSVEGTGSSESLIFSDYFTARKQAKKIIRESYNTKAVSSEFLEYREIAPDHWISENQTIIISTVQIEN